MASTFYAAAVPIGATVANPLYLIDPADTCPVCGTRLRDNRAAELRPCPFGPHEPEDYPRSAA